MTNVNWTTGLPLPGLTPAPTGGGVPGAPVLPTGGAPALPTDQLALGGAAPDDGRLAAVQAQLASSSPIEASLALYQLEPLAATHRPQVVALLVSQLTGYSDPIQARVALDLLGKLQATEAVPYIQQLSQSTNNDLRSLAASALNRISPPAAPAPPALQPAATAAVPTQNRVLTPVTTAAPTAPAPAAAGQPTASTPGAALPLPNGLSQAAVDRTLEKLKSYNDAPGTALQVARMPTPLLLAVYARVLDDPKWMREEAVHLLTLAAAKRVNEPGVADQLRRALRVERASPLWQQAKAAAGTALQSTGNPAYLADSMRFLLTKWNGVDKERKAFIDKLAASPTALANPAVGPILVTLLKEEPSSEVRKAISHALGNLHTAASRDALAASPLLTSGDSEELMRGMWDLSRHPAPYPKIATDRLLRIVERNVSPQLTELAKSLLQKSGVKA